MALIYVKSGAAGSADGSSWANAFTTLAAAAAVDAAGDTIYVSDNHAESTAAGVTLTFAGTPANPVKVICADDSAEPPTAVATTATVTTTGANAITVNGSAYVYGITFNTGTGGSSANLGLNTIAGSTQTYEDCKFNLLTTSSGATIAVSSSSAPDNETTWKDCFVKFGNAGQRILPQRGVFVWNGGGITAGGTSPTYLIAAVSSAQGNASLSGLDLSAGAAGLSLFQTGQGKYSIRNSKLPASWSGSITSGTLAIGGRYELHNCDATDTNYRFWVRDYYGDTTQETTLIKTGGASDGTTGYSMKVVTTANSLYPAGVHETLELPAKKNSTVGSAITVTVDILRDSATNLTDAEVWLEVQYLGTSGFPLSTFISDAKADILATAADQTASSATWTTTGMSNPNEQKLEVTFTPQEVGFIQARVVVCKASTTLYVDAKLQVS